MRYSKLIKVVQNKEHVIKIIYDLIPYCLSYINNINGNYQLFTISYIISLLTVKFHIEICYLWKYYVYKCYKLSHPAYIWYGIILTKLYKYEFNLIPTY